MNAFGRMKLLIQAQSALGKIQDNWAAYQKENPMLTFSQVLKSRTVWTLIVTGAFNGWNSISGTITDTHIVGLINGIFALLALVFRISPNQHVVTAGNMKDGGIGGSLTGTTAMFIILSLCPMKVSGQVVGAPADYLPQHAFGAGFGVGPTTADYFGTAGFAEKVSSNGTYSYTVGTFIPHLIPQANGHSALTIIPTVHTGIRQLVWQQGRLSLLADLGAGVSVPTVGSSGWNFSALAGGDAAWRLNREPRRNPGDTNNFLMFTIQAIQLTGTAGGTAYSAGLGFLHTSN